MSKKAGLEELKYEVTSKDGEWKVTPTLTSGVTLDKKALKAYVKRTAVVESAGVKFQADIESIGIMSSVMTLGLFKMMQAIEAGAPLTDAITGTLDTDLNWMDAKNNWQSIKLRDLGVAIEDSVTGLAQTIAKYS